MKHLKNLFYIAWTFIILSLVICTDLTATLPKPLSVRFALSPSLTSDILNIYNTHSKQVLRSIRKQENLLYEWPIGVADNLKQHLISDAIYDLRLDLGVRIHYRKSESQISVGTILTRLSYYPDLVNNYSPFNYSNYRYYSISHQYLLLKLKSIALSLGGIIQLDKYKSNMIFPVSKNGWLSNVNQFNLYMFGLYPEFRYTLLDYLEFNFRLFPLWAFSKSSGYNYSYNSTPTRNNFTKNYAYSGPN